MTPAQTMLAAAGPLSVRIVSVPNGMRVEFPRELHWVPDEIRLWLAAAFSRPAAEAVRLEEPFEGSLRASGVLFLIPLPATSWRRYRLAVRIRRAYPNIAVSYGDDRS